MKASPASLAVSAHARIGRRSARPMAARRMTLENTGFFMVFSSLVITQEVPVAVAVRQHFTRVIEGPECARADHADGDDVPFRGDQKLIARLGPDGDRIGIARPVLHADRNHCPGADGGAVRQEDIRREVRIVDLDVGNGLGIRDGDTRSRQENVREIIVDPAGGSGGSGRANWATRAGGPLSSSRSHGAGCAGSPRRTGGPGRSYRAGRAVRSKRAGRSGWPLTTLRT